MPDRTGQHNCHIMVDLIFCDINEKCPVFSVKNWTTLVNEVILFFMNIADIIRLKVGRFSRGYVFTFADFVDRADSKEGLIKALNRLAASGEIAKLGKGKYYKPEQSPFGELPPNQYQVVKDLLERGRRIEGYITGLSIYNALGLTTQVSNTIQIGKNEVRSSMKRGKYSISFVKQKNTITRENTSLLQLLDVLRFIKKIPDSKIDLSCKVIQSLMSKLSAKELEVLVRLAFKYPPSTRALLGAILDSLGKVRLTVKLRKSLNPITIYKIPGVSGVFSSASEWSIK